MAMPVSFSKKDLVLDAIGALKITHYHGQSRLDDVYCYLRSYVRAGTLVLGILSFERTPPPESRAGAAFAFGDGEEYLFFSCNRQGDLSARLYTRTAERDIPGREIDLGQPERLECRENVYLQMRPVFLLRALRQVRKFQFPVSLYQRPEFQLCLDQHWPAA